MSPGHDELPKSLTEPIAIATSLLFKPGDATPSVDADPSGESMAENLDHLKQSSSGKPSDTTINEVGFSSGYVLYSIRGFLGRTNAIRAT